MPDNEPTRRAAEQRPGPTDVEGAGATGGPGCGARGRWRGLAGPHTPAHQVPPVWRAPEGPEGTGGLRGAATNEVRPPSLAGGRARPGHSQPQASPDWRPPRGLRGLAGLRADAPSEARGADGERAGRPRGGRRSVGATNNKQKDRRPPAHAAAGPAGQRARRPEHQRRHKHKPYNHPGTPKGRVPKYPPLVGSLSHCLVEA